MATEAAVIDIRSAVRGRKPRGKHSADGECLILLYHRVCTLATDPLLLCVSEKHFAEQLDVLRSRYRPISLSRLVEGMRDNAVRDRSVVVTFDDGYLDILQHAKPLLERFDIPATVFVASGYVGASHEFWWDELDRILLQPGDLPKSLRVRINGSLCEHFLGNDALDTDGSFERRRRWNVEREDLSPRECLFRRLQQTLRPLDERHRRRVLNDLIEWAGTARQPRESHRALTADDLTRLGSDNLIEIGGHTATHPKLPGLDAGQAEREIVGSKAQLEDRVGAPVRTFAYPFGAYDHATLELVRTHYDGACTAKLAAARPGDPHRVSRIDMYYLRSAALFRTFGTLPGRAYLGLRALGRRLRGA